MEYALTVNNLKNLQTSNFTRYSRVYFGTEFCEKLLPSLAEVKKTVSFCREKRIEFTLLTPWCTDVGIDKIKKIIPGVPKDCEIVFNDWGVFELIKSYDFQPVLGRLLVSVKRDPRLVYNSKYEKIGATGKDLGKNSSKEVIRLVQTSTLNNPNFQSFLIKNKIFRIDLDNISQGYNFKLIKKIKLSLHYPYVYTTISRKCLFANLKEFKINKKINISSCNFNCFGSSITADIPNCKRRIILKGNSQFYFNSDMHNLKQLKIDRLIVSPNIT